MGNMGNKTGVFLILAIWMNFYHTKLSFGFTKKIFKMLQHSNSIYNITQLYHINYV